jgi:prepilin-type N-terminal cleavage/methylation domain-containing protein
METTTRRSKVGVGQHREEARGFTLIEVMVVLALTLVMMAAFAQIFSMTGTFVTKQKGVGENDQAARILTTVLKADLANRSMRYVAPFHPNMPSLGSSETSRIGYFEYSENNPLDDTDDVLQFTIAVPLVNTITNLPNPPLYGTATFLPKQNWQPGIAYATGAYVIPQTGAQTGFIYCATVGGTSGATIPTLPTVVGGTVVDGGVTWTCVDSTLQADGDDGIVFPISPIVTSPTGVLSTVMLPQNLGSGGVYPTFPASAYTTNNTGASQYAEVCYFLRHGNLYRRVLLVREPYNAAGSTQPGATGLPIINGAYAAAPPFAGIPAINGAFWADFDYSARFDTTIGGPRFFDSTSLNNAFGAAYLNNTFPLGRPDNRFGHDQTNGTATQTDTTTTLGTAAAWPVAGQTGNGAPREYDSNGIFLGRYTDEETSNQAFEFPGAIPTPGSPMAQGTIPTTIDTTTGGVTQYTVTPVGTRRGEDILLTNVISFDVKIWDPHYSESAGNDVNRNGVIDSGPAFADIGHSAATGDFLVTKNQLPTYGPHASQIQAPAAANPNTFTGTTATYNNGNTTYFNNVFDTWYRTFNFDNVAKNYDNADSTLPNSLNAAAPYRPRLGVPWQPTTAYALGALVDPLNGANGYVYQCTGAGISGTAPGGQPDPFSLTDTVGVDNAALDGTVTWQPVAPLGVQAIQITVKYLDPTQNLLRQVTIVQSLAP